LHSVALARFPQSGQLEIFGANAAGQIFYCAQKTANDPTSWDSCWQSLGGSLKAVSAEANPDGSIDLFGVNSGGQYFLRTTPGGTEWHNDTQFDEATSAGTVTPPRFDFLSRTASGLTVQWDDQSTNELGFAVERQDNFGLWNPINLTPTLNSGGTSANLTYSFSDGTVADGCYRVIAYNHDDSGVSAVHCSS
jgi:hypothetical protein